MTYFFLFSLRKYAHARKAIGCLESFLKFFELFVHITRSNAEMKLGIGCLIMAYVKLNVILVESNGREKESKQKPMCAN